MTDSTGSPSVHSTGNTPTSAPSAPQSNDWITGLAESYWPVLVLFPVLYGLLNGAALLSADPFLLPEQGSLFYLYIAFKSASAVSIPVLLYLVSKRVADKPRRWLVLLLVWSVVGCVVVVFAATYNSNVAQSTNGAAFRRLWPGQDLTEGDAAIVEGFPFSYTTQSILVTELLTVVVLALLSAALIRWLATQIPALAAVVVPIAVFSTLVAYTLILRWPLVVDYDFFVGDAALGGTFAELLFPPLPFDLVGGSSLGIAAATMGMFLALWGPKPTE